MVLVVLLSMMCALSVVCVDVEAFGLFVFFCVLCCAIFLVVVDVSFFFSFFFFFAVHIFGCVGRSFGGLFVCVCCDCLLCVMHAINRLVVCVCLCV